MRLGLVGTSEWAVGVHGAGVAAHPDVELTALWGRDPAKAAAAADRLGTEALPSFDALLEAVDAVVFAVPPDAQAPLAVRAAAAGRHLVLEKPISLDVAQARAVADAVEAAGVASVVFLTRVFIPALASWLADLRGTGAWDSGRAEMVSSVSAELLTASPWRAQRGALWDLGPHALSVLERVLGPVVEARALSGARDLTHLQLRHDSGATSTAELTLTAPPDAAHTEFAFWGAGGRSGPEPVLSMEDVPRAHAAALSCLVRQAGGDASDHPTAAYGLHVTEVLALAEASLL